MVNKYKRRTSRASTSEEQIIAAVGRVINGDWKVRAAAREYDIPHVSLKRYVDKQRKLNGLMDSATLPLQKKLGGYSKPRIVFNEEQESELARYIISSSDIYFGLTPMDIRKLAYECAVHSDIPVPDSWKAHECAGRYWFTGFLQRQSQLSLRIPESTSQARARGFNKVAVDAFYDKLGHVIDRYGFEAKDIWNVDETGVFTVAKPKKKVSRKGAKQVGDITSAERGQLVTVCPAVSATGNTVPPLFIFPRVNYRDHFVANGPTGCAGWATPSGWMDKPTFKRFMEHFVKHVRPSKEKPVLLILDNHDSHLGLETLTYAKENGVVMLSFPPHTSHKLQPLDVTVYGPFKNYIGDAHSTWLRNNPGRTISIYDIPKMVAEAWPRAATPANIMKGFETSGIAPFNRNRFTENDYRPSDVTDRPMMETATEESPSVLSNNPGNEVDENNNAHVTDVPLERYLASKGRKIVQVRGDGHCLLYAALVCLHEGEIDDLLHPDLCDRILKEVELHEDFYADFVNDTNAVEGVRKYIFELQYNTDSADLVVAALCNALHVSATIFVSRDEGGVFEIKQTTTRGDPIDMIELALTGTGYGAHYHAVVKMRTSSDQDQNPHDNTPSDKTTQSNSHGSTLSPELVRPLPKAPADLRKRSTSRKRRHTAILTDTPEKDAFEAEQAAAAARKAERQTNKQVPPKKRRRTLFQLGEKPLEAGQAATNSTARANKTGAAKGKGKGRGVKATKINTREDGNSSEEDDAICLVCTDLWSNSKPGEKWANCVVCQDWAHTACVDHEPYICHNCNSDDDI
ncbi:Uncharacterised protein g6278 [Pycnogonum litorale]